MVFAEGGNYRIEIVGQVARFILWRRPDLDSKEGARLAAEAVRHFERLAQMNEREVRAMLQDIREGPVVAGPITQKHVANMLTAWARCGRPLAIIVGSSPIQLLQYRRMVADHASRCGRLFTEPTEAERWISEQLGRSGADGGRA